MTSTASLSPALARIVDDLDRAGPVVSRRDAVAILGRSDIAIDDVKAFVRESQHGYARVRVARTDAYELLVMTWLPGQGSLAHDHAGSICALRVLQGHVEEAQFRPAVDGLVDAVGATELVEGEVIVDQSHDIHALTNRADAKVPLVTLHVYAPPLPELRRFSPRGARPVPCRAFLEARDLRAPVVAIVGGGFSGTLAAAQVLRRATECKQPVHVVLHDRQATFGEGPAYRTPDPHHLLNVPAAGMSAWPDRPEDFLRWARERDGAVAPYDFLPRKRYGDYVRDVLLETARAAGPGVTLESLRVEVDAVTKADGRWLVTCDGKAVTSADALVLATGHRPPDDPLAGKWRGSRTRYVQDPWATLVLSAIRDDETVVLLGTGLTAIDVILSVTKGARTAPVIALSRRGLLPAPHADAPVTRLDPTAWLEPLLSERSLTARALLSAVRRQAGKVRAEGGDWRGVIDGLRPHTARIWRALPEREARRFLRAVRPYWEIHRHRTAPSIARKIEALTRDGLLVSKAGRVLGAEATSSDVRLSLQTRGGTPEVVRADWVVNCTGPGAGASVAATPVVSSLVNGGFLELDALGLGVRTDEEGRALVGGRLVGDLHVVGTLRKADLWESTAVPELRGQAAQVVASIAAKYGWQG